MCHIWTWVFFLYVNTVSIKHIEQLVGVFNTQNIFNPVQIYIHVAIHTQVIPNDWNMYVYMAMAISCKAHQNGKRLF